MPITSVNSAASDTQLLAPGTWSHGVSIYNTDVNALYIVADGSAASTTNFTVKLNTDDYWEAPPGVVKGAEIRGIWAADGSGAAKITYL